MQPPARPELALTMNDLNLHALSAHVVAWHNRHPLARRITAAQVYSVGYVALPFLAGAAARAGAAVGAQALAQGTAQTSTQITTQNRPASLADTSSGVTLRERAMARAQGTETGLAPSPDPARAGAQAAGGAHAPADGVHAPAGGAHAPAGSPHAPAGPLPALAGPPPRLANAALAPAFSEDFIAPLAPSRVARWAAVQGVALARPPAGAPVRLVAPDSTVDVARLQQVWVLTAQLEAGRSRTRVLVGAGDAPSVLGRRLWSRARIAALSALGTTLLAAALALQFAGTAVPGAATAAATATATATATTAATTTTATISAHK